MPTTNPSDPYGTRELFRFVRMRPLEIVDVARRAGADEELRSILELSREEQVRWAQEQRDVGGLVQCAKDLESATLQVCLGEAFSEGTVPDRRRMQARDPEDLPEIERDAALRDEAKCLRTIIVHKVLGNSEAAESASQAIQALDVLRGRTRVQGGPFAPAVLDRFEQRPSPAVRDDQPRLDEPDPAVPDFASAKKSIELLWRARSLALSRRRAELLKVHQKERSKVRSRRREAVELPEEERQVRARAYFEELQERRERRSRERQELRDLEEKGQLSHILDTHAAVIADYSRSFTKEEIENAQAEVGAFVRELKIGGMRACDAFEHVAKLEDKGHAEPVRELDVGQCFSEHPDLDLVTFVRVLGLADLVTVEETFLRYTEGEISYVENILAGEVRRREVKSARLAEQVDETVTEESTDQESESRSKIGNDLQSQIQTEISSRFNTDVNASASGSGGGSIGVVDLQGGASLNAGFGIGVDTSLSTSTESAFSQEVVSRSIERARQSTYERRMVRSQTLHETLNFHEIDNTIGTDLRHRRGIYCFLDKHICITEKTYGQRMFLMANVLLPGKNLICEQRVRTHLRVQDVGQRPEFNISPNDIHPSTYKDLVGRFQASNIQPPPQAIRHLAKTYKTDQTNANSEQGGGFKDVAKVLVPFFDRYNRFLVTDTIQIPEGYRIQEVKVTVNHGANGISIPAHLPLSLGGAALYSAPLLGYSVLFPWLYLPVAVWQMAYLASPLLHYNVDSSNVTVCVGNEAQDSPYYFFPPDQLLHDIIEFITNFAAIGPDILSTVQEKGQELIAALTGNAVQLPGEVEGIVTSTVQGLVASIGEVFQAITRALDPTTGEAVPTFREPNGELTKILEAIGEFTESVSVDVAQLQELMGEFFEPLGDFLTEVFTSIGTGLEDAIPDFIAMLLEQTNNSQNLDFVESYGLQQEIPISLNVVSIHPGITVNVVACLSRTEEALEAWRLETFGTLYQAYLQQLAEYEARNFALSDAKRDALSKSPGTMRGEEHRSLKELVIHALNNHQKANGSEFSFDRMNLFEHAIDWPNISYKLYNYGPSLEKLALEAKGIFKGADARRKAFMTATWAQVMIPLQSDSRFEQALLTYLESGEADLEKDIESDELAALYQALIQSRALLQEDPQVRTRREVVPTDLIVIKPDGELPVNEQTQCTVNEENEA